MSVLEHFSKHDCFGHRLFLFAEDDVLECPSAQQHWRALLLWMHVFDGARLRRVCASGFVVFAACVNALACVFDTYM